MKVRNLLLALSMVAAGPTIAQAAAVAYEGVLISGIASSGSAGGYGWFFDDGANVDFWRFQANAGDQITLQVDRLNGNFDPALSLYKGMTTADAGLFTDSGDWGGLSFVGSLDDENPPHMQPSGPNGDPYGTFTVTDAGWYTVAIGGSNSTDDGAYPYSVTMSAVAAVPEPSTFMLLGLGLLGLGFARRRS